MEHLSTPPAAPSASPGSGLLAGALIAERYKLLRKLGEGAMGAVFLAEHIHMRKRFALKILHAEAMASPEIVARFEREAVAAGNIGHPGVCAATDFGRLPDGGFFLVLEFVDGLSLRKLVEDGALAPARALEISRQVLAALGAAHAIGVVHRDVKPENVMVVSGASGNDVVKVLDFGIAKVDANTFGEGQGTNLTRMGAIYGTPAYMAPEQAMGKPIDHRVDLYAVGVMLHEMIAARPPFDGDGIMLLAQQVNEPPPPLVSPLGEGLVTPEIAEFVGRLLAKAPADRFDSASAAVAAIDAMRSPDRLPASAASPRPPPVPLARPAEQPTLAGTVAGAANTAAPSVAGRAATGSGPKRAASASTIAAERLASVRAGATRVVERAARRVGLPTRTLVAITAGAVALLVLSLLLVALRTSPPSEQEERAKRPRPRSGPTASTTTATPTATAEPPSATTADPATPAATPTTSAKSAGGGIKGIGRKIKGLF